MNRESKIFLVDDNADYRFLTELIFTQFKSQYAIRYFESGNALSTFLIEEVADSLPQSESLIVERPDLILLDLQMKGKSGLEVLQQVRQHTNWQWVPIVMMSNTTSPQDISDCYATGANSFIAKPTDINQLRETLEQTCHYWLTINRLP